MQCLLFSNNKYNERMIVLEDDKIENLLIRLLEEMAIVKSKLEALDDLKTDSKTINIRVDKIEAMNERHDHTIKSLENRANKMEEFTRNQMTDAKKTQTSAFISIGIAVFSAVLSVISGLLF